MKKIKAKKYISMIIISVIMSSAIFSSYSNVVYASSLKDLGKELVEDSLKDWFLKGIGWASGSDIPLGSVPGYKFFCNRTIDYFDSISDKKPQYSPSSGVVGTGAGQKGVINTRGGGGASRIPYDDESTYTHGGGGHSRPGTSSGGTTTIPSTDQSISGGTTNTYNSFSLVKNESVYNTTTNSYENKSYIYSPVTKTYNTVNKITYAPSYTTVNNTTVNNTTNNYNNYTYNFQTNNYNYYVTNNYTYVSYYITPASADTITGDGTDKSDDTYLELYYELPDGRNSYDLKAEDVWGQYNIYNVVGYESVAEDAGTTLALLHLDSDLKDSSYFKNTSVTAVSNVYTDGAFKNSKKINGLGDYIDVSFSESLSSSWTIEFFIYINNVSSSGDRHMFSGITLGSTTYHFSDVNYMKPLSGTWSHVAFCFDGGMKAYVNGREVGLTSAPSTYCTTMGAGGVFVNGNHVLFGAYPHTWISVNGVNFTAHNCAGDFFDEIRISKGVVYNSNFNIPAQPFDTNQVLCVPSSASEHDIAVKGEYKISDYRIGGVRPTYPTNGYVYISLEDDKVTSIQQYQSDGWYEVDAAIYEDGEWYKLKGFDMKAASFDTPSEDNPKDPDKPNDPDKPDNPDKPDKPPDSTVSGNGSGESGGIWDSIKNLGGSVVGFILKILEIGLDLLTKFVNGITSLLAPIEDMITSLLGFTESFSGFLSSMLLFVPDEIISVLVIGLTLMVILAVIKFIRG